MIKVKNTEPHLNANDYYWYHKDENGVEYLFSDYQLQQAAFRATQNTEDLVDVSSTKGSFIGGFLIGLCLSSLVFVLTYAVVNFVLLYD
jgi:hypothetical protein